MLDDILSNLNPSQQEAVTYEGGPLLVLAGAGSGKTRVLTHRVAWLIGTGKLTSEQILLLTFTNKAANEMKERVATLVGYSPPLSGTFHSFCARLLRLDGEALGISKSFVIYDEDDQKDLIREITENLGLSPKSYRPGPVLAAISGAKNEMLSPLSYGEIARGEWQEKIFKIYLEYEKGLKKNSALDFDDLINKTVEILEGNKEILSRWEERICHILVDEWQDTNKAQYKLTKLLSSKRKNITAVGDASQSIYRWRGADYRNIIHLTEDFPNIKIVNLEQNYRSTQTILDSAYAVISKNKSHPILKLWTKKGEGERVILHEARSELDEAGFVVSEIQNLMETGYKLSDFAILYRTNAQSRVLEEAFLHSGLPYSLVGGVRFYARREVKDIISYLRLVINPKDSVSRRRAEKIGKRRLFAFEEAIANTSEVDKLTTLDLMDSIIEKTSYLELYDANDPEDFMRLENIKELRSVASQFPNLVNFLENIALVESEYFSESNTRNSKKGKNRATLMTIHAAKGLEFSVVFLVGLEEGLFPHSQAFFDAEQMEEERRLAYVAITRAKDLLYLVYSAQRLYFGQRTSNPPSRFIIDIPESLLENGSAKANPSFENEEDLLLKVRLK